ncbi:hypothetical protein EPN52_00700 [bacterium]|nr:MAG: hypothetical protein EPN52_00700 [bacterium]
MQYLAKRIVAILLGVLLTGVVSRAAEPTTPLSTIYSTGLVMLLQSQPDLIEDQGFVFNYGLIFGCSGGRQFDQITIHSQLPRWRNELVQLAHRHPSPTAVIAPRLKLGSYDYDQQFFPRPEVGPETALLTGDSYLFRQSCRYAVDDNSAVAGGGVLPALVLEIVNSGDISDVKIPRAIAERVLRLMGGQPQATYRMTVRLLGVAYNPTAYCICGFNASVNPYRGLLVVQAELIAYEAYPGASLYGRPLATWKESQRKATQGALGSAESAQSSYQAAPSSGAVLDVKRIGSWLTPGSVVGSPAYLYQHERLQFTSHGSVQLDAAHVVVHVALPNGGSTTVAGMPGQAPSYWQTDFTGTPVYGAPKKPTVAPAEDLGGLGTISLTPKAEATYVVTFAVPVSDEDATGHINVLSVTWQP